MVSATQNSKNCVLLLLSLLPPFPPFLFTAVTVSLWPALALAALKTPKTPSPPLADSNTTTLTLPNTFAPPPPSPSVAVKPAHAMKNPNNLSITPIIPSRLSNLSVSTHLNSVSFTSEMSLPLLNQTFPSDFHITSPTASMKIHCRQLSNPLFQPLKRVSQPLSKTCEYSAFSQKIKTRKSLKKHQSPLSKISLYPVSPQKVAFPPATKPQPNNQPNSILSSSTFIPSSQNPSDNLPSPHPNLTFPTEISPITSTLPSRAQTLPAPPPKIVPSPPKATSFRQPVPSSLLPTTRPLFEHHPFIVTWNIPDLVCNRYNISLDTSPFKGVANPAKVPGQFLSLFYTDRLGLYPQVDLTGRKQLHGGIPQRGNLKASLNKAQADINYYIPSKTSRGLAVIDWEEWRPLWDRNWGTKKVYQTLSVAHAKQTNHSLTAQEATDRAKQQFQEAARNLMSGMLSVGTAMRPNYLWGFYLFPNCYNSGWEDPDYTGQCSKEVKRQNDELLWLWESSTALFPSIYLQASLADSPKVALMVRNRVQEAFRVSALPRWSTIAPVFVYTRPVFVDQNKRFLSRGDLISTIGESAALGASGAVLWGASADYDDQASCEALSSYLTSTVNPYIANVTAAAQLCSNYLCRGNGRCVRKNYKTNHYLHLNPDNFRVLRVQRRYLVLGRPTLTDLKTLSKSFTCQCYKGLSCTPRTYRELAKALAYSIKQGSYYKSNSLRKAALDNKQKAIITKSNLKKYLYN